MKFGLTQYTLDAFFNKVIEKYPNRPALAIVGEEPFTYSEFGTRVSTIRKRLRELGVKKNDKIVLLGNSSPNWAIAFMAITTMGAIAVPILEEFPEIDIDHIIKHSDAVGIFISESLYENLSLSSLASLQFKIRLNDFSLILGTSKNKTNLLTNILDLPGKIISSFDKTISDDDEPKIEEDNLAEILYTSGTTGHSKGVMLTHKNLVSNLFEGPDLLGVINERSIILSILPLAHAFGTTSAFLSIIRCGASIYYLNKTPSPKILIEALQQVKPTIMGAVPLVFEKIYHKQVMPLIAKNKALNLLSKTELTKKFLYKIIGKKIYKLLGGKLECVIIGGANLSREVEIFMKQAGIPYCCGYGLSECSPLVTFSSMQEQKIGSPGHAISDVKIKILNPDPQTGIGEILIKGPNVMKGYYKNDELTRKSFTDDGWFISGDKGYLDKDGFIFITGRSKNVIIGPSGENIYPEVIEMKLVESIFVEEAIVYQSGNVLIARIYPNYAYIETLKNNKDENIIASDIKDILESVRIEVNAKLSGFSKISKVIEQTSPFIKTPTNKIKRAEYIVGYMDKN